MPAGELSRLTVERPAQSRTGGYTRSTYSRAYDDSYLTVTISDELARKTREVHDGLGRFTIAPSSTVNRHTRGMKSPIARGKHKSNREIEKRAGTHIDRSCLDTLAIS